MDKDIGYLEFMRDKAREAQGFVAGLSEDRFLSDNKTQSAVILKLAIIGEIAKKISPEAKDIIDLPWKEIAGFRDMAIHEYLQLSLTIIWATTQQPLFDLITKIDAYLSQRLKRAA
jgi:uncharacterized protein with HEPN domain